MSVSAARIDLDAIRGNVATLKRLAGDASVMAVVKADGYGHGMLESARAYVLGQYPLNFETGADWAAALGEIELYGLGAEYIDNYGPALRNVTLRDTRQVIDEAFPSPDALAIVLVGDAAKIRDQVTGYGAITAMTLMQPVFDPAAHA